MMNEEGQVKGKRCLHAGHVSSMLLTRQNMDVDTQPQHMIKGNSSLSVNQTIM
jgi:hypothetical protein